MTPKELTHVDLYEDLGLYQLLTSSSTVYYIDTRDRSPRLYRAKGTGHTMTGHNDNKWVRLTRVLSGPAIVDERGEEIPEEQVDQEDRRKWVLRIGSRHEFDYRVPGGLLDPTDFWYLQRVLERIVRLDEMPPEGERTIEERVPRPEGV